MALTVTHLYINDGTESILIGAGNGDACDFPATLIGLAGAESHLLLSNDAN